MLKFKYENVHYINCYFIINYCANYDYHPNKIGNELIVKKIIGQIDNYIRGDNSAIKENFRNTK